MPGKNGKVDHNMRSYGETFSAYKTESPEYYNFGFDVIDRFAEDPSLQMMLWAGDDSPEKRLSYADFRDRSNQVANALNSLGLRKSDHVMIVMSRVPEWWESMIGMIKAGIVAVPGTTQLTEKDIRHRLEASHIKCVITDSDNASKFDGAIKGLSGIDSLILVDGNREGWLNYESIVSKAAKTIDAKDKVITQKTTRCCCILQAAQQAIQR